MDVEILVSDKDLSDFFDKALRIYGNAKNLHSWLSVEILSYLNENKLEFKDLDIDSERFVKLIEMVDKNEITRPVAKEVLRRYLTKKEDPLVIIEREGLRVVSDTSYLQDIIKNVISNNSKAVEDWKKGKNKL